MISTTNTFQFAVIYEGQKFQIKTYEHEYRNLMVMIKDRICPDDFGQCGGMGKCGTCLVRSQAFAIDSDLDYRNEGNTLAKMGIENPEIRLSCQVQVNDDLKNIRLEVLDNI